MESLVAWRRAKWSINARLASARGFTDVHVHLHPRFGKTFEIGEYLQRAKSMGSAFIIASAVAGGLESNGAGATFPTCCRPSDPSVELSW